MTIDIETWLKIASFALSVGAIVYAFFANRKKDTDERFKDVDARFKEGDKRMDKQDGRMSSIEQTVTSMPGRDDVHRLEIAMTEMSGEMKAVAAHLGSQKDVMRRLENVVTRHEDHLLDGGKSK